jgi:hypothetical protein
MSPADLADDADKQQNNKTTKQQQSHEQQPVFLCEIMQLAAFPLRDLRNLRENIHARGLNQSTQTKPQCLPLISLITQTNPITTRTTRCLSLRYNAACRIPLRYMRENNHIRVFNQLHKRNPNISR